MKGYNPTEAAKRLRPKMKKKDIKKNSGYQKLFPFIKELTEQIMEIKYSWFIEPLDSFTNEVISRELPEENCSRETLCADGKKRNLWRCGYALISQLKRSKKYSNLKFRVFVRQGGGKIRQFNL